VAGNEQRVTSSEQRVASDEKATTESQSHRDAEVSVRRVGCRRQPTVGHSDPRTRDALDPCVSCSRVAASARGALHRPPNRMFMPHSTLAGLASTPHQIKP